MIEVSHVPSDAELCQLFKEAVFEARNCGMMHGSMCNLLNVSCNNSIVTVNFDSVPPPDAEDILAEAWKHIPGLRAADCAPASIALVGLHCGTV